VNLVTYVLSSYQPPSFPNVLNSWYFLDPVYGLNFSYPNTFNGGPFVSPSFLQDVDGGLIFPWGYPIQNTNTFDALGTYKGLTTLTITPSSLDDSFFAVVKISYDFDDNDVRVIEKGIVENTDANSPPSLDPGSPVNISVSHVYQIPVSSTTYYPTVTVVNGNLSLNIFKLQITIKQDSIFDFDNFNLINSTQLTRSTDNTYRSMEVFEVNDESSNKIVTNFLLLSSKLEDKYDL